MKLREFISCCRTDGAEGDDDRPFLFAGTLMPWEILRQIIEMEENGETVYGEELDIGPGLEGEGFQIYMPGD